MVGMTAIDPTGTLAPVFLIVLSGIPRLMWTGPQGVSLCRVVPTPRPEAKAVGQSLSPVEHEVALLEAILEAIDPMV